MRHHLARGIMCSISADEAGCNVLPVRNIPHVLIYCKFSPNSNDTSITSSQNMKHTQAEIPKLVLILKGKSITAVLFGLREKVIRNFMFYLSLP